MTLFERLKNLQATFEKDDNANLQYINEDYWKMRQALPKLLAFVAAWDDCQTVTTNQMEKLCVLLSARKALDEETK